MSGFLSPWVTTRGAVILVQIRGSGAQAHLTSHSSLSNNFRCKPGHIIAAQEPLFLQGIDKDDIYLRGSVWVLSELVCVQCLSHGQVSLSSGYFPLLGAMEVTQSCPDSRVEIQILCRCRGSIVAFQGKRSFANPCSPPPPPSITGQFSITRDMTLDLGTMYILPETHDSSSHSFMPY